MMRIGFNCHLLGNTDFGVETTILGLARALFASRESDEVLFYLSGRRGPHGLPPESHRVYSPFLTRARAGRIVWEQLGLPWRSRRDNIELLHAPGYIMPLASRMPVVLTVHDLLALRHPEFCKPTNRAHYRLLLPRSVRKAQRIIVPSRLVRDQILAHFPVEADRVTVIPPGVDDPFFASPREEELNRITRAHDLPERFLLFAGRFEPKKNLGRLLEAYKVARRKHGLDASLVLVGGCRWGKDRTDRVTFPGVEQLGYIARVELPSIFHAATALVFPSLAEGFGLPVLEAMATGLPVVCSDVPAALESDPESVLRIDPGSTDDLARALVRIVHDDALRATLIERGRNAATGFTWARAADRTWQVYREVLSG